MGNGTNVLKLAISITASAVARIGLIDEKRGKRIADLAWPRVLTGLARQSKITADLAMVGLAIGPGAIAGLGFAFAYWSLANATGWSFANGGMAFYSQRFGADDQAGLDLAIKQTYLILFVVTSGFVVVMVVFAEPLIGLLGAAPASIEYGSIYLQVVALALLFDMIAQVAERVLISANDAWSPMVVRVVGGIGNIVLNAIFIFGLGWGVYGAALGTVIASFAIAAILVVGLINGWLPLIGDIPVQISLGPPYLDIALMKQILRVGSPLVGEQAVSRLAHFVMLAIIASFGTIFVAAYAVAREIRELMNIPGWGFSTAARSLVGQALGKSDERTASLFGRDTLRFTMVVYALMSVLMFTFADQIAPLFTDDPRAIDVAIPFIMVMAVSLLGLGIDSVAAGIIGGAGDTTWPLYARLVGLYLFMLPIAYVGVLTPLGIAAVYLAVTAETVVPALITYYRFRTDKWKAVSRRLRESPAD